LSISAACFARPNFLTSFLLLERSINALLIQSLL
jgi:hypothetical protein